SRHFGYSGVAALEAISPGIPGNSFWKNKWNGLTGLPTADHSAHYYYPANANAALAAINRSFFPNANAADKAAMDSRMQMHIIPYQQGLVYGNRLHLRLLLLLHLIGVITGHSLKEVRRILCH